MLLRQFNEKKHSECCTCREDHIELSVDVSLQLNGERGISNIL